MLDPFAAAEQRANAAVMRRLANARVSIGGAQETPGIFDNAYVIADVGNGMAATAPAITVPTGAVPSSFSGTPVTVVSAGGTSYWTMAEHHPDGTGLSVVLLERTQ